MNEDEAYELYRSGRAELESGNLETAERLLAESQAIQEHAKTAELLGESLMLQGKADQALSALKLAVRLGKEARATLLLAKAWLMSGNKAEAEVALREALKRNPQYHPAQEMLAELCSGNNPG